MADGSTGWFKIFKDDWSRGTTGQGSGDNWGTKDLNSCCGKMDVKIPSDISAGDYLLRAEVIALHVASSQGGAQFYASCCASRLSSNLPIIWQKADPKTPDQLTVTGGGSASPALVQFPGAYSPTDPGILINIYQSLATYVDPGPTVYSGGSAKTAGSACSTGGGSGGGGAPAPSPTTTAKPNTTLKTTSVATPKTTAPATPPSGCTVAKYGQCGGTGWTGCTVCAVGLA